MNDGPFQIDKEIGSKPSISAYESKNFKSLLPQIIAAFSLATLQISVGMSLAYSGILIPQLEKTNITLSKSQTSWIASVVSLASPLGALSSGFLMDHLGRLNTIRLSSIPGVMGWIGIALAHNFSTLICGRILVGFATALGSSPIVVYITEIARPDMRGSLISLAPTFTSMGMLLVYLEGWFLDWRTVAYISLIFILVPCTISLVIPESPQWLISKNRPESAKKSLKWLCRYQNEPNFVQYQLAQYQREHELALSRDINRNFTKKMSKFLEPSGYKPLLLLIALFFFSQFSGVFIVFFYSVPFFKETGTKVNPYLASITIALIRLVTATTNTYTMKAFKKRPLILFSGVGVILSIFLAGLTTKWVQEGWTTMNWLPVFFLLIYIFMTMVGVTSIPTTMTAELFPIEIRGLAHSTVRTANNLLQFAAVKSYPTLYDWFGGIVYVQWFFAGIASLGLIFDYFYLPETHGKKLTEIQQHFLYGTFKS